MGGSVKTLRHSNLLSRSVFSAAGSFGMLFDQEDFLIGGSLPS